MDAMRVTPATTSARKIARTLTKGSRTTSARDYTVQQFGAGSTRTNSALLGYQPGPTPATPYDVSPASVAVKIAHAFTSGIANRDVEAKNARVAADKAEADAAVAKQQSDYRAAQLAALTPEGIQAAATARRTGDLQAEIANPLPVKRVAIMDSDWQRLAAVNGIPKSVMADREANGGTLSEADSRSFQSAVDNLTAEQNAKRMAAGASQGATQEELKRDASSILDGIQSGYLSPNIELYGTNRDGMKRLLASGAVARGLDLNTLRQNWYANQRGLSGANTPQQLRMRQAANNIHSLLAEMRGVDEKGSAVAVGPDGNPTPGLIDELHSTAFPIWNDIAQEVKRRFGAAGALKRFNIVASKLAMEQSFLMSGGNQPPESLYKRLLGQYEASSNPENIYDALGTVEETVNDYQRSISETGYVSPTTPYTPGPGPNNAFGSPGHNLGTNPPAGTFQPGGTPSDATGRPKRPLGAFEPKSLEGLVR